MTVFEPALAGMNCWRIDSDGSRHRLPVYRWHGRCQAVERRLLRSIYGRTLDVGCGPGRLTAALTVRGVPALGVDTSPTAVRLTRRRGGRALRRSVFEQLPTEGHWRHLLLADGNIGIGGDPLHLLRRCAELVTRGGTLLVECEAPGAGLWRGESLLRHNRGQGPPFPWARVGVDEVAALAAALPLHTLSRFSREGRWFIELEKV